MNASLLKTQTVLTLRDPASRIPIYRPEPEEGEVPGLYQVQLDKDVFEDMGKPAVITVTIELGDTLNS